MLYQNNAETKWNMWGNGGKFERKLQRGYVVDISYWQAFIKT